MKAEINGRPILASGNVSWKLTSGVRPNIQTFDMIPADAELLRLHKGPVNLRIGDLLIEKLYVLDVTPGENPHIQRVRLADRRFWWTYKLVNRMYNKRRNVGFKRIKDPAAAPEILKVVPKVWYRRWTLKNQTEGADPKKAKWDAPDILEDVLTNIGEPEKDTFGEEYKIVVQPDVAEKLNELPIENFQLKDSGDAAMRRTLTYLPGAEVYVDYNGDVVVYSKVSGEEKEMIAKASPKIVGQGDVRVVDNSNVRPSKIRVYFQYMSELRFDFDEAPGTQTADDRFSDNVLPVPDYTLVKKDSSGNVVTDDFGDPVEWTQGTWITFNEAFNSWGEVPTFNTNMNHDMVQKAMSPFMGLWAGIQLAGSLTPNVDWAARLGAIQAHYRRTYRINRQWVDRVHKLMAFRTALVNPTTGTRAPAVAYSDYCYVTGQRALFNEGKSNIPAKDMTYVLNVKGHPAIYGKVVNQVPPASLVNEPASKALTEGSRSAPGNITLADADQGILRVDYQIDPFRLYQEILPSMMTRSDVEDDIDPEGRPANPIGGQPGPSGDIRKVSISGAGRSVCFDAVGHSHLTSLPKLTKNFKMSMIITAIPGAPNSEASLFCVEIDPDKDKIRNLLPEEAKKSVTAAKCKGPIMDIYIGAKIEVARVPWVDEEKTLIQGIFLNTDGKDQSDKVKHLVLNYAETTQAGASLRQIARSASARLYASLVDRFEGDMAGTLTPGLTPAGWLSEVEHILSSKGEAFSKMSLPEAIKPLDIFTFMDSSTRAVVLGLATPDDVTP